jgi:hypothetical protein
VVKFHECIADILQAVDVSLKDSFNTTAVIFLTI